MLNAGILLADREEHIVDELDDNTSVETLLSAPPDALDPVAVSTVTISTVSTVTMHIVAVSAPTVSTGCQGKGGVRASQTACMIAPVPMLAKQSHNSLLIRLLRQG